ncbi:unnamed protein product [Sphacelaria rigidula]
MLTMTERKTWTTQKPWAMGVRPSSERTLCYEGFVRQTRQRHRSGGRFEVSGEWRRTGDAGEYFPDMRAPGVHHNTSNLPFCGIGAVLHIDAFNVHGMTQLSEDGTYATVATTTRNLQRSQRHPHVTTVAEAGATVEGELSMVAGVIGAMENGCIAECWVRNAVGVRVLIKVLFRGGLFVIIADSPQRAVLTNAKHLNGSTLYPCPYCRVKQTGEHDCPLGRHVIDITSTNRCRQEYEEAFARLEKLPPGSTARVDLSKELGVVPRREGLPHPMYDLVRGGEILRRIPPEALHADALNHLGLVQPWPLSLLNERGREWVSSFIRQRSGGLYAAGAVPVKDLVRNYASYTASHKWELASTMLLVFREPLRDVENMENYMKANRLSNLGHGGFLTPLDVLTRLRKLVQCSSMLTYTIRSPEWGEKEFQGLHDRVKDYMLVAVEVIRSEGVRPSLHSLLHLARAVRDVGVMPDASVGEHAHQIHKRSNKSSSGRTPAAHHIQRLNTRLALKAMADGTSWLAVGRE